MCNPNAFRASGLGGKKTDMESKLLQQDYSITFPGGCRTNRKECIRGWGDGSIFAYLCICLYYNTYATQASFVNGALDKRDQTVICLHGTWCLQKAANAHCTVKLAQNVVELNLPHPLLDSHMGTSLSSESISAASLVVRTGGGRLRPFNIGERGAGWQPIIQAKITDTK